MGIDLLHIQAVLLVIVHYTAIATLQHGQLTDCMGHTADLSQ